MNAQDEVHKQSGATVIETDCEIFVIHPYKSDAVMERTAMGTNVWALPGIEPGTFRTKSKDLYHYTTLLYRHITKVEEAFINIIGLTVMYKWFLIVYVYI